MIIMKQIYANNFTTLELGRKGENLARQVVFDVRDLESLYGPGDVEVIYQRPGDAQPYPLAVQRDGTLVTWDVTATDTEMSDGYGKCELRYYVGETLAKSKIWRTWVEPALPTPSETAPPEPEQGWVEQVLATGVAAQQAADAAKADADRAATLAAEVAVNAAQTAQDASDAAKAMEAAQTAQRLAEEAQSAAEAARTAAAAAQAAAEKAATDAAGAKQDAETAQKAAQDAATAAANALEAIQTLYQEMQTWAQGVVQDVNAAGSAAVQSVQSAGDTQIQRVAEEGTRQTSNAKAQADAAAQSASGAAQSAQEAAESAAVYDDVVADVNQLKQDVAAITPDDTTVDGKPWTSKKIVDSLCMPIEETGNPVQVYPVENYPLVVKVSWKPTQEGEGDPSPDNIRPITGRDAVSVTWCGKNLLDLGDAYVHGYNITGMPNFLKPNTTYSYTVRKSGGIAFAAYIMNNVHSNEADKQLRLTTGYVNEGATQTFTTPADMKEYPYFILAGSKIGIGDIYPDVEFQLELGSSATPYEPYTGSTTDIALPETVYGGEVDAVSSEGQETWKMLTLDGTEEWRKSNNNYYEVAYRDLGIPSSTNDITAAKLSQHADRYIIDNPYANTLADKCVWVYSTPLYSFANLRIKHEAEQSTLETWRAYLAAQYAAGTPVQICYKLAEPVPFNAAGAQPIPALSGVNTLYTDADGVVVTGAEDPKHTITELKNAIISLGGNV